MSHWAGRTPRRELFSAVAGWSLRPWLQPARGRSPAASVAALASCSLLLENNKQFTVLKIVGIYEMLPAQTLSHQRISASSGLSSTSFRVHESLKLTGVFSSVLLRHAVSSLGGFCVGDHSLPRPLLSLSQFHGRQWCKGKVRQGGCRS